MRRARRAQLVTGRKQKINVRWTRAVGFRTTRRAELAPPVRAKFRERSRSSEPALDESRDVQSHAPRSNLSIAHGECLRVRAQHKCASVAAASHTPRLKVNRPPVMSLLARACRHPLFSSLQTFKDSAARNMSSERALWFRDPLFDDTFSALLPFATGAGRMMPSVPHRDMPLDVKEVRRDALRALQAGHRPRQLPVRASLLPNRVSIIV